MINFSVSRGSLNQQLIAAWVWHLLADGADCWGRGLTFFLQHASHAHIQAMAVTGGSTAQELACRALNAVTRTSSGQMLGSGERFRSFGVRPRSHC